MQIKELDIFRVACRKIIVFKYRILALIGQ